MNQYKIVRDFGANIERLIGYFYSGLSAVLVIAILKPKEIKDIIETLGSPIAVVTSLALGIGLYSLYFHIIGELFFFQLQRFYHYVTDLVHGYKNQHQRSNTGYVGYLGVTFSKRRQAYECLKNELINDDIKTEIHLKHGELSIIYISATYCFMAYGYCIMTENYCAFWLYIGLILLIGAIITDTAQHSKENYIFKQTSEDELKKFLRSRGLLKE
ncbi:hypothetical protein [Flavobacterium sp. UBA4197]|uniref:hypothetical protein n=1 Tax=Flavobacterium sp. UBA4197 TaxID=1946546 RepID=UPI00257D1C25|nr:hypothetical protein [Flavobacterium sp. UBA4197]